MDDLHETLKQYTYYKDDDKLFKVNLSDTFISNSKIKFLNDIKKMFEKYFQEYKENQEPGELIESCDRSDKKSGFHPLLHQELIKVYLNSYSPYRGLLLYHGLGSGKTCSSIGIIEAMKTTYSKIFILTPASLKQNYITQLKFCGTELFKSNLNNWEYVDFPQDDTYNDFINQVMILTNLPRSYLETKEGVFLFRKDVSPDTPVNIDKKELYKQIQTMIENRFTFISYNGISENKWKTKYKTDENKNVFDNSVIIIALSLNSSLLILLSKSYLIFLVSLS